MILGTDTAVGKTHLAVELIQELRRRKISVGAYKPVASGMPLASGTPGDLESRISGDAVDDPTRLCLAAGWELQFHQLVCPQQFRAPLAPPSAAHLEHRQVDEQLLVEGAAGCADRCDFLVVESAGGVMSPISQSLTVLDLAVQLGLPTVLVAPDRLGCVGQVLLAVEAIGRARLPLTAVLLNQMPADLTSVNPEGWIEATRESNRRLIRRFCLTCPCCIGDRAGDAARSRLAIETCTLLWTDDRALIDLSR